MSAEVIQRGGEDHGVAVDGDCILQQEVLDEASEVHEQLEYRARTFPSGPGLGLGLIGLFTTIVVMVTSIGGGALAAVGWRWLFLVVPVVCAVSFVLTPRLLPPMPRVGSGRVDLAGLALLGAGMVTVISGMPRVTAHPPDRAGWLFILAGVVPFASG